VALNPKNALFSNSDSGGDNWAVVATPVEGCKISAVEVYGCLANLLTRTVKGHPNCATDDFCLETTPLKRGVKQRLCYIFRIFGRLWI
jgi:hypothetical protein